MQLIAALRISFAARPYAHHKIFHIICLHIYVDGAYALTRQCVNVKLNVSGPCQTGRKWQMFALHWLPLNCIRFSNSYDCVRVCNSKSSVSNDQNPVLSMPTIHGRTVLRGQSNLTIEFPITIISVVASTALTLFKIQRHNAFERWCKILSEKMLFGTSIISWPI